MVGLLALVALLVAAIALVRTGQLQEQLATLRDELQAIRAERTAAPAPAQQPGSRPDGPPAAAPAPAPPGDRLTDEELQVLDRFIRRREGIAAEARARIAAQLASRFEARFPRAERGTEEYLLALHAGEMRQRRAERAGGRAPERSASRAAESAPAPSPPRPSPPSPPAPPSPPSPPSPRSSPRPEPAPSGPRRPRALELETQVGTTWALRIGLAALAIAVALFARSIVPSLSPVAKVALAYAGALALFGLGRVFEARLERFARPVMAGGLAIGFFVSYASHFVPAMRALPLAPALVWMAAGVLAVLLLAERWGSERTAGLAIFLGHVSAYVAGGVTEVYSLIVILFLALAAVALLWRHDWLPLSLFALAASYGSHLLWAVTDRGPAATGLGIAVNVAFLASYYGIFLGADLLAWRRRDLSKGAPGLARALGPANLVLAVSLTSFLYLASDGPVTRLSWVFFALGALQVALAPAYRRLGNPDHRFYPALGAVLVTLGFAAALDGLSLNLVLALEAVALLVAAHATRLRVFHLLAQGALAANFVHYWTVAWQTTPDLASYIGGLAIAAAYLVQAVLEDAWYAHGARAWRRDAEPGGAIGVVSRGFDALFGLVAPWLAYLHGFAAAVLIAHQSVGYLGSPDALVAMGIGVAALAAIALGLRSVPVMLSAAALQAGAAMVAHASRPDAIPLLGLTGGGIVVGLAVTLAARPRGFTGGRWQATAGLAQLAVLAALQLPLAPWAPAGLDPLPQLVAWLVALAVGAAYVEAGRGALARSGVPLSDDGATLARAGAGFTAVLVALGALVVIARLVGDVAAPVWATGAAAALLLAALWRGQPAFTLGALTMLVLGDAFWLVGEGLGDEAVASTWITALLAGVPLAAAVVQDRLGPRRLAGPDPRLAGLSTYVPYLLGSALVLAWCEIRVPEAWSSVAFAALPAAILALTIGAAERRGLAVAVLLALVALVDQLAYVATTSATGVADLLAPGLLLSAAALVLERTVAAGAGDRRAAGEGGRFVGLALLLTATILALATVSASWWLGGPRTTIGWSLVGGALMAAGFAARSADYRRVALVVLGIAVVRVFAVDTRGLSDTAKTLAFFALGLSLVAVAWLYSRFGKRIRDWL